MMTKKMKLVIGKNTLVVRQIRSLGDLNLLVLILLSMMLMLYMVFLNIVVLQSFNLQLMVTSLILIVFST